MKAAAPACAVCFTTDQAYLLPTLVAAIQARQHSAPGAADIWILCFDADPACLSIVQPLCAIESIRLLALAREAIDGAPVMLARLFLDRLLPEHYRQLLYFDGDIQITGSIDPLIDVAVPENCFLAANDPITFTGDANTRQSAQLARHASSLGLSAADAAGYFNSGVIRINRNGWAEIGGSAWNLYRSKPAAWRFPDQDVLNVVARASRMPMSLVWNFPIFLRNSGLHLSLRPRVNHFMSSPKPWEGVFAPWQAADHRPYQEIVAKYPALEPLLGRMGGVTKARYQVQQRIKRSMESISWGLSLKRRGLLAYEQRLAAHASVRIQTPNG